MKVRRYESRKREGEKMRTKQKNNEYSMYNNQGRRGTRSEDIPSVEPCKKTPCSLCLIFMDKN